MQEVLREELLEALPELVLLARHERGVRDRQPQRVPEQGGDREPVRDGPHHAGLRTRVDEAEEPVLVQGQEVDHRGEPEQASCDPLHPAQPSTPVGVRLGVLGEQWTSHGS